MTTPMPAPRRRRPAPPRVLATLTLAAALGAAGPVAAADAQQAPPRATDGTVSPVAGTAPGFAGDGGPATQAQLDTPRDVAVLADGSIVIADFNNDRVRRITIGGTMTTAAGSSRGRSGDGGPAEDAELNRPRGVTSLADGGYLVADTFNHQIRRVRPDGTIVTVAGTGTGGLAGDGGAATGARLNLPSDTVALPGGGLLIADSGNDRVRRVAADGTITTVAGSTRGFSGDGGPATAAQLSQPRDIAIASDGAILIADTGNDRVRRVAPDGTISTLAGVGAGLAGDGDPARTARLTQPFSIVPLTNGGVLVADTGNNRVRRITPLGAIFTVAGTSGGLAGDGGLAKAAQLTAPGAITAAPGGGFLVADTGNARVRRVSDVGAIPPAVTSRSFQVEPGFGKVSVSPAGGPAGQPLKEQDLVPVASSVQATDGGLNVTTTGDDRGTQQTARVYAGGFTLTQTGTLQAPITNFRLPALAGCRNEPEVPRRATRSAASRVAASGALRASIAATRKRKRRAKRLWVKEDGGRWQSATGSTSAAAVGTGWLTTLQCDGTRVTVTEGRVLVRDLLRKRSTLLRAGQSTKVLTRGSRRGQ